MESRRDVLHQVVRADLSEVRALGNGPDGSFGASSQILTSGCLGTPLGWPQHR